VASWAPFVRRLEVMRRFEAFAISLTVLVFGCGQGSKGSGGTDAGGDVGPREGGPADSTSSGTDATPSDTGGVSGSDSGDDSGTGSGDSGATGCSPLAIDSTTLVDNSNADTYAWSDSSCKPRTAALFRNETMDGLGEAGGYLRTLTYQTLGQSRTCTGTNSGAGGWNGFGYIINHDSVSASDTLETLGKHTIVLAGRHHAIHEFTWTVSLPGSVNVTAQWVFATGKDHPLFVVTFDATPAGPNAVTSDTRAPYGDMGFDNNVGGDVTGEGWGDTHKFTTTGPGPVTAISPWDYTASNSIPYAFEWSGSTDSEMGLVAMQAWTTTIQGGDYAGGLLETLWGKTGTDLLTDIPTYEWPFQLNQYQLGLPDAGPNAGVTNAHRLAWGSTFGAVGQTSYTAFGKTLVGYPYQSYTVAVVLGAHSVSAVAGQVGQMENVQASTLTASRGTVSASGPAGIARTDTQPYVPVGFDPVYGVWDAQAAANAVTLTLAPGGGPLANPVFRIHGYTANAAPSKVTFGGATLTADKDYFATVDTATTSLWLTLNATLGSTGTLTVDP